MVSNETKASLGRSKRILLLAALVMILTAAIGGTIAYIVTSTTAVENTFTPAKVETEIKETFDGTVKTNVSVKNTGEVAAYIRAAIVVSWKTTAGETYAIAPGADDYTITLNETDWVKIGDYWYCKAPVAVGANTAVLIDECKLKEGVTPPNGYYLSVDVITSAIQAEPTDAVTGAWGVTLDDAKNITASAGSE